MQTLQPDNVPEHWTDPSTPNHSTKDEPVFGKPDASGNYALHVESSPSIIFSTHYYTVHRQEGMQHAHCEQGVSAALHPAERDSNCLDADDAAGIWLQLRMIEAGVPGTYVALAAEEIGRLGSAALVDDRPS